MSPTSLEASGGGLEEFVEKWKDIYIQQFLGLTNYYCRFICGFADLANQSTFLLNKIVLFLDQVVPTGF